MAVLPSIGVQAQGSGKATLQNIKTGEVIERWAVDAREILLHEEWELISNGAPPVTIPGNVPMTTEGEPLLPAPKPAAAVEEKPAAPKAKKAPTKKPAPKAKKAPAKKPAAKKAPAKKPEPKADDKE